MVLMKHQNIPKTMIIYLSPLDHSRTLQSGTIPQDAIVPGTSQEQVHHSKLPKVFFRSFDYYLSTTGTHQNQKHPSVQFKTHWEVEKLQKRRWLNWSITVEIILQYENNIKIPLTLTLVKQKECQN